MSKGLKNYIVLTFNEKEIWEKLSNAVTDPARIKKSDPGNPDICNIYSLHKLFSNKKEQEWVNEGCRNAKIGCVECKKKLCENINKFLLPIREKYFNLMKKPQEIKTILKEGAKKANAQAQKVLDEVYELVGFKY